MKFCDDSNIPESNCRPASKPLPEDVRTSLHHSKCKVSEFLHDSYCFDLEDKQNTYTFMILMASTSVSLVCSRQTVLNNRSFASPGLMLETWQDCRA